MTLSPLHLARASGQRALAVVGVLCLALFAGYEQQTHTRTAGLVVLAPVVVALILRPQAAVVLGIALLPVGFSVSSGGFNISPFDLLSLLGLVGFLLPLVAGRIRSGGESVVCPVLLLAAPLTAWLLVVATYHASFTVLANTFQQVELFLLPLLLGAVFMSATAIRTALRAFVVVGTLLALAWIAFGESAPLGGNKNPAAQFMGDAVLLVLLLAARQARWLVLIAPLVAGLLVTGSRGALVGTGVGVAVFLTVKGLGSWQRTVAVVVPLTLVVLVGFNSLPDDVRARTATLSVGNSDVQGSPTPGEYSLRLREVYSKEGKELVRTHPVFGVGPGNYLTGDPGSQAVTVDPHNVILRTAGDSGYPGLLSFGVLVVGSALLVFRRRRVSPLPLAALAVQAALLTHGLVDVYWVRGTPVLGWLLLGMALNPAMDGGRA